MATRSRLVYIAICNFHGSQGRYEVVEPLAKIIRAKIKSSARKMLLWEYITVDICHEAMAICRTMSKEIIFDIVWQIQRMSK